MIRPLEKGLNAMIRPLERGSNLNWMEVHLPQLLHWVDSSFILGTLPSSSLGLAYHLTTPIQIIPF
jgi:hypothetical protein